jgi:hypothetical protein
LGILPCSRRSEPLFNFFFFITMSSSLDYVHTTWKHSFTSPAISKKVWFLVNTAWKHNFIRPIKCKRRGYDENIQLTLQAVQCNMKVEYFSIMLFSLVQETFYL